MDKQKIEEKKQIILGLVREFCEKNLMKNILNLPNG